MPSQFGCLQAGANPGFWEGKGEGGGGGGIIAIESRGGPCHSRDSKGIWRSAGWSSSWAWGVSPSRFFTFAFI